MALTKYKPTARERIANLLRIPYKFLSKVLVPIYAIWGRYPWWMVTPDDPVSPFGCGTTPGASTEQMMVDLYARFGRYVGDVVWLGWRNSGYGLAYAAKPDFLKRPGLRYWTLAVKDDRSPMHESSIADWVYRDNSAVRTGTLWVQTPDGSWLWETTRKLGPVYVITGYRLSAIASGYYEDNLRAALGLPMANRPVYHPNMDGRPIVSLRTARTM